MSSLSKVPWVTWIPAPTANAAAAMKAPYPSARDRAAAGRAAVVVCMAGSVTPAGGRVIGRATRPRSVARRIRSGVKIGLQTQVGRLGLG